MAWVVVRRVVPALAVLVVAVSALFGTAVWAADTPAGGLRLSPPPSTDRTLTVGVKGTIRSLDPLRSADVSSRTVIALVLDGLYEYLPDGTLVPRLAAGEPEWEHPTAVRIRLRPGVTFHDGSVLTAEDVAFTLRRMVTEGKKYRKDELFIFLKDAVAEDETTVLLRLQYPVPNLVEYLARIETFPVSKPEALRAGLRFGEVGLIGTGPYRLDEVQPGVRYSLRPAGKPWLDLPTRTAILTKLAAMPEASAGAPERAPGGAGDAGDVPGVEPSAPGSRVPASPTAPKLPRGAPTPEPASRRQYPFLAGVEVVCYSSFSDLTTDAEKKKVQVALGWEPWETRRMAGTNLDLRSTPPTGMVLLYLNPRQDPWGSPEVRSAVAAALAPATIAQRGLGMAGRPLPHLMSMLVGADQAPVTTNRPPLQTWLAEQGITPEKPLQAELLFTPDPHLEALAHALAEKGRPHGIWLFPVPKPKSEIFDRLYAKEEYGPFGFTLILEDWQDFRGGFDVRAYLRENLFSRSPRSKVGEPDWELDELIICLDSRESAAERREILVEVGDHLEATMPVVPVAGFGDVWGVASGVRDAYWSPAGWVHLKEAWRP